MARLFFGALSIQDIAFSDFGIVWVFCRPVTHELTNRFAMFFPIVIHLSSFSYAHSPHA